MGFHLLLMYRILAIRFWHCLPPRIGDCGIRGLPVVGCARAPTEGRLPSQRAGSGPNSVTSRTAASIWTGLHRGVRERLRRGGEGGGFYFPGVGFGRARGEAGRTGNNGAEATLSVRYIGSAGIAVRVPGEQRAGRGRMLDDATRRAGTRWCGVAGSIAQVRRWRGSSGTCRRSALQSRPYEVAWQRAGKGGNR